VLAVPRAGESAVLTGYRASDRRPSIRPASAPIASTPVDPERVISAVTNPEGRRVRLDDVTWNKIMVEHVEMADKLDAIMATIEMPDHREPDPRPGNERFFRRGGPQRWIRVVTRIDGNEDKIVTAFPQDNDPEGLPPQ
jgi:hypothetical protein